MSRSVGKSSAGRDKLVNVEYVWANPTGPMHVGHGRGAVFGDALANLLGFAGYKVTREYYVNDAGAQATRCSRVRHSSATAKRSATISVRFPEGRDSGDYLKPVGAALAAQFGDKLTKQPETQWLPLCAPKRSR